MPAEKRGDSSTGSKPDDGCELHGFLVRIERLNLGPNTRHSLNREADDWEREWKLLAPPGPTHFRPMPRRTKFEPLHLEKYSVPLPALNLGTLQRVGKQKGALENFSIHLLGGAAPSDPSKEPTEAGFVPHVERRTTGPFDDDGTEDRNTRAPLVLLSSEFELFRTGVNLKPFGEIGRINCPNSSLKVKLSTQDAPILARIAARFRAYMVNADAALSYGTTSLRPRLPGFGCVKQKLTERERWQWSFLSIVHARHAERREISWETLQADCSTRVSVVAAWKRYIYQDLRSVYRPLGSTPKDTAVAERQLAGLMKASREIENDLEYDQCIMYRRMAWMQVMSEVECAVEPLCTFTHGRDRMLKLVDNASQQGYMCDFSWLCPAQCHCENIEYELCIAEEALEDTGTIQEFIQSLTINPAQRVDFTGGGKTALTVQFKIINEARLPEVRFRVVDGNAEFGRRKTAMHKVATFSAGKAHTFASGVWVIGSPLAENADPISVNIQVSGIHVVHGPALGSFLGEVASSFAAAKGALGARLPPLSAGPQDLGASGMPAAKTPSLAGGSVEADQLAGYAQCGIIVFDIDHIQVDLPLDAQSDGIHLSLHQIGVVVGLPEVDQTSHRWCCDEHEIFGHWPGKQLYQRSQIHIGSFGIDVQDQGLLESVLQPSKLDIVVDSCLIPQQWQLPNMKVDVQVSELAVAISPASLLCSLQCINRLQGQQYQHSRTNRQQMTVTSAAIAVEKVQTHTDCRHAPAVTAQQEFDVSQADEPEPELDDDWNEECNVDELSPATGNYEKIQTQTCFCLLELANCTGYTLKLEHWVAQSGQLLSDVNKTIPGESKIQWATAQRGKLKGNCGCVVFSIDDEADDIHVEFLLMWSVPFVGEDTASVAVGTKGEFTYMSDMKVAKQRRELCRLMNRYNRHLQAVNVVHRANFGNIQVSSSFGRAPCKFAVVHRHKLESVHGMLHFPDDPRAVKQGRGHLMCHIKNDTRTYLQVIKCVFGKMEGECIKAIDPIVPPGHECIWTCATTRKMRGNNGCAIFSVGGVAELLIQWFVPTVGKRVIDCVLSHNGSFSKISDAKLQDQVEEGPNERTCMRDFTAYKGYRVTHEMRDGKSAFFGLSASDEVINDADLEPTDDLLQVEDFQTEGVQMHNYHRLALEFRLSKISTSILDQNSDRKVVLEISDIGVEVQQSDFRTTVVATMGTLECEDTFYSESDMSLVSTHAFGSADNFINVRYEAESHPCTDHAHHGTVKTKVFVKTSPLTASYTYNTIFFVMSLSKAIQKGNPNLYPTPSGIQPTDSQSWDAPESMAQVLLEDDTVQKVETVDDVMVPVFDLELQTGEVSISICNSKLTPLVQIMLNKIDATYKSCGLNSHGACGIDLGVFYHNMELSAWEPLLEWCSFQIDMQTRAHKSTTSIVSDEPINFNVTSEMLVSLIAINVDMKTYYDDDTSNDPNDVSTVYVVNNCGVPISFNIMNQSSRKSDEVRRQHMLHIWTAVDTDGSGSLDCDEVCEVMTKMGLHMTDDALTDVMAQIDTDGSGELNFAEFLPWYEAQTNVGPPANHTDHRGWTKVGDGTGEVPVPRNRVHMDKPQSFDPSALGNRGELSTNYVIFRFDRLEKAGGTSTQALWAPARVAREWRPLRPQSLSLSGSWLHFLEPTSTDLGNKVKRSEGAPERPFVCTKVYRKNGATYITAESPVLITNHLPVGLTMQLADDAEFETHNIAVPSKAQIPVPLNRVGERFRFKQQVWKHAQTEEPGSSLCAAAATCTSANLGYSWSEFIHAGDVSCNHVLLVTPEACCAYPVYMDRSRVSGPNADTCNVIVHCPLKFENLLPCEIKITLAKQQLTRKGKVDTKSQSVIHQEFFLKKGEMVAPAHVDVRFGMTISVEMQGNELNCLKQMKQREPAVIWPVSDAHKKLKYTDDYGRKLKLQFNYDSSPGKPTIVSIYATHWIMNETGLGLEYFDVSKGSGKKPANHEHRQWDRHREPFMWSFPDCPPEFGRLGIGLSGKPEGEHVSLNHPEHCATISVKQPKSNRGRESPVVSLARMSRLCGRAKHQIVCSVVNGKGRFLRTKMVYLRHELELRNQTTHPFMIRCVDGGGYHPVIVMPTETRPFSWPKEDEVHRSLYLFYDISEHGDDVYHAHNRDDAGWSGEFEIGMQESGTFKAHIGEQFLKVARSKDGYRSLRVAVTHDSNTNQHIVVVTEVPAPYKIENHLPIKVGLRQLGTENFEAFPVATPGNWQELEPKHFMHFNWDLPLSQSLSVKEHMVEIIIDGVTRTFDINTVGSRPEEMQGAGCVGEIVIEGHTRVLKLFADVEHLPSRVISDPADILDNVVIEARFASVGISLVDNLQGTGVHAPKELLYTLFDGIHFHSGRSGLETAMEIQLADWQIADQTVSDDAKSVVFGRIHSHVTEGAVVDADTINDTRDHFHLSVVSDLRNSSKICDVYSFVAVGVRPSHLRLDDDLILKLWKYSQCLTVKLALAFPGSHGPDAEIIDRAASGLGSYIPEAPARSQRHDAEAAPVLPATMKKVYFRRLEIHPICLEVSVNLDGSLFDGDGLGLPGYLQSLGVAFGNIDQASMSFEELIEDDVFEATDEFAAHVSTFYWSQFWMAKFRLFGASAFLGNPIRLLGNLSTGLGDFFYVPARGLVTSPTELVKGFAKGTESLIAHTLKGVLETAGGATGAVGKGLDKLSDSADHAARVRKLREQHGTGVVAGLTIGTECLALGLLDGLSGIVLQPLHGLKAHGLPGLMMGIERGLVGAVAQPAAGALAFVSDLTTGAAQTSVLGYKSYDELRRARIPRPFFHGRLLTAFSHEWAVECLRNAKNTDAKPQAASLKICLYSVTFPEVAVGCEIWSGPLKAKLEIGHAVGVHKKELSRSTSIEGLPDALVDPETGIARWSTTLDVDENGKCCSSRTGSCGSSTGLNGADCGHEFKDITIVLEDNALPPAFEVLSITILSSPHSTNGARGAPAGKTAVAGTPLAQFDVLLAGLGLANPWKMEAHRERSANIHTRCGVEGDLSTREQFDRMDKHGDGQVSRAELIQALKANGVLRKILGLPAQVGDSERMALEVAFSDLDRHGSRHFGWTEFEQYLNAHCMTHIEEAESGSGGGQRGEEVVEAHPEVRVRQGASWERVGLHTSGQSPKMASLKRPANTPSAWPGSAPGSARPLVSPATRPAAADEAGKQWVRNPVGEGCWVDVGLRLVDECGQLDQHAEVRMRSESRTSLHIGMLEDDTRLNRGHSELRSLPEGPDLA